MISSSTETRMSESWKQRTYYANGISNVTTASVQHVHARGFSCIKGKCEDMHIDIAKATFCRIITHDIMVRIHEVRTIGDDPAARVKLKWHSILILVSAGLSVIITFMLTQWLHWDCLFPVLPNWLQEGWDWIYKQ